LQGLGTTGDLFEGAQALEAEELKTCLAEYYENEPSNTSSAVNSSSSLDSSTLTKARPTTQRLPRHTQLVLSGL
jgi:hypothetical protein